MMNNKPLRVVFSTSEAVPSAKTGGLADVTGSLAPVLAALGRAGGANDSPRARASRSKVMMRLRARSAHEEFGEAAMRSS